MLASLQDNNQVGEVVCLCTAREQLRVIFLVVFVTKLFQNVKNNLRVNSSHPERLEETSHALLKIAFLVVLTLQILLESLLGTIIFPTNNFCNLVQADSSRIQQDFSRHFANLILSHTLKSLFDRTIECFWLDICLFGDIPSFTLLG